MPPLTLTAAIEAVAGALLIGILIGAQREEAGGAAHPGLRDFLLVSLAGGLCGVLGNPWLDAAALVSITAVFAVFHYEDREERSGITTELAAIGTFLVALLAASYQYPFALPLAAGIKRLSWRYFWRPGSACTPCFAKPLRSGSSTERWLRGRRAGDLSGAAGGSVWPLLLFRSRARFGNS